MLFKSSIEFILISTEPIVLNSPIKLEIVVIIKQQDVHVKRKDKNTESLSCELLMNNTRKVGAIALEQTEQ